MVSYTFNINEKTILYTILKIKSRIYTYFKILRMHKNIRKNSKVLFLPSQVFPLNVLLSGHSHAACSLASGSYMQVEEMPVQISVSSFVHPFTVPQSSPSNPFGHLHLSLSGAMHSVTPFLHSESPHFTVNYLY